MKILIVSTVFPFIEGGGTFIVDWLDKTFKKYGYRSEVLKIPCWSHHTRLLDQMLAIRLMDISDKADRVIAIRTPAHLIRHPDKILWFIHHQRQAYDLWGTKYQSIPNTPEGLTIRNAIIRTDNVALRESKKIYTNSKVVSDRLKKFNGLDSEVLYPPLLDGSKFYCEEYGDYIFYPSRLTHHKRQFLAVEAMKHTVSNVKLIIAGNPENNRYLDELKQTIDKNNLAAKVKIVDRWISEQEKVAFFAKSLGCAYFPFDEDSYGYPSLEAYHAKKPVITCTDSGGTMEIVEDGVNGFVTSPEPKVIAECFDKLFLNKQLAKKMGEAGYSKLWSMKNISWDHVIGRLTS